MKRVLFAFVTTLLFAAPLLAQEGLPGERWWRRPEIVKEVGLTAEQQSRLDAVFKSNATDLVDLRANLEKSTIQLREAVDNPELDREAVRRAAAQVSDARARLFEREVLMMVDMRGTMSPRQWGRLRSELGKRRAGAGPGMGPGMRPGGPRGGLRPEGGGPPEGGRMPQQQQQRSGGGGRGH